MSFKGKRHSEESKAKTRAALIGRQHSAESVAKMIASKTGKPHSLNWRIKLSRAQIDTGNMARRWEDPAYAEKIREQSRRLISARWADPVKRAELVASITVANRLRAKMDRDAARGERSQNFVRG